MNNIRVIVKGDNYIVVKADSKRFGNDAIMFEGNTFNQCFNYIRRVCHVDRFSLSSYMMVAPYTDREGRTLPWIMDVHIN